ncbi:hypothetical protein RvY_00066-2 [Ramazzottius varieornatus]|uniref:Uncharacterized protein n=1 Tax=Ramazzottius varieornatus TaxID=947166 RepID=A0A1D1UBX2_RAMVA|nr:hypothetical protein RvY_00066-2 [Ramazzottius varieornatus]
MGSLHDDWVTSDGEESYVDESQIERLELVVQQYRDKVRHLEGQSDQGASPSLDHHQGYSPGVSGRYYNVGDESVDNNRATPSHRLTDDEDSRDQNTDDYTEDRKRSQDDPRRDFREENIEDNFHPADTEKETFVRDHAVPQATRNYQPDDLTSPYILQDSLDETPAKTSNEEKERSVGSNDSDWQRQESAEGGSTGRQEVDASGDSGNTDSNLWNYEELRFLSAPMLHYYDETAMMDYGYSAERRQGSSHSYGEDRMLTSPVRPVQDNAEDQPEPRNNFYSDSLEDTINAFYGQEKNRLDDQPSYMGESDLSNETLADETKRAVAYQLLKAANLQVGFVSEEPNEVKGQELNEEEYTPRNAEDGERNVDGVLLTPNEDYAEKDSLNSENLQQFNENLQKEFEADLPGDSQPERYRQDGTSNAYSELEYYPNQDGETESLQPFRQEQEVDQLMDDDGPKLKSQTEGDDRAQPSTEQHWPDDKVQLDKDDSESGERANESQPATADNIARDTLEGDVPRAFDNGELTSAPTVHLAKEDVDDVDQYTRPQSPYFEAAQSDRTDLHDQENTEINADNEYNPMTAGHSDTEFQPGSATPWEYDQHLNGNARGNGDRLGDHPTAQDGDYKWSEGQDMSNRQSDDWPLKVQEKDNDHNHSNDNRYSYENTNDRGGDAACWRDGEVKELDTGQSSFHQGMASQGTTFESGALLRDLASSKRTSLASEQSYGHAFETDESQNQDNAADDISEEVSHDKSEDEEGESTGSIKPSRYTDETGRVGDTDKDFHNEMDTSDGDISALTSFMKSPSDALGDNRHQQGEAPTVEIRQGMSDEDLPTEMDESQPQEESATPQGGKMSAASGNQMMTNGSIAYLDSNENDQRETLERADSKKAADGKGMVDNAPTSYTQSPHNDNEPANHRQSANSDSRHTGGADQRFDQYNQDFERIEQFSHRPDEYFTRGISNYIQDNRYSDNSLYNDDRPVDQERDMIDYGIDNRASPFRISSHNYQRNDSFNGDRHQASSRDYDQKDNYADQGSQAAMYSRFQEAKDFDGMQQEYPRHFNQEAFQSTRSEFSSELHNNEFDDRRYQEDDCGQPAYNLESGEHFEREQMYRAEPAEMNYGATACNAGPNGQDQWQEKATSGEVEAITEKLLPADEEVDKAGESSKEGKGTSAVESTELFIREQAFNQPEDQDVRQPSFIYIGSEPDSEGNEQGEETTNDQNEEEYLDHVEPYYVVQDVDYQLADLVVPSIEPPELVLMDDAISRRTQWNLAEHVNLSDLQEHYIAKGASTDILHSALDRLFTQQSLKDLTSGHFASSLVHATELLESGMESQGGSLVSKGRRREDLDTQEDAADLSESDGGTSLTSGDTNSAKLRRKTLKPSGQRSWYQLDNLPVNTLKLSGSNRPSQLALPMDDVTLSVQSSTVPSQVTGVDMIPKGLL